VRILPTLRSEFSLEQFEKALQELAHRIPKFKKVVSDEATIDFRQDENGKPKKIHVYIRLKGDYLTFSIEPKQYLDSHHITKISFDYYGDDVEKEKARINQWLENLMKSIKPIPRFKLSDAVRDSNPT